MPVTPTYPGVYIEEVSSGVRTIAPVATGITAFVGTAPRGPANDPVRVQSFAEYQRAFGALHVAHAMGYAVYHYFQNRGQDAYIIRVVSSSAVASKADVNGLPLVAASAGAWGNSILARVDHFTKQGSTDETLFNLSLYEIESRTLEEFRNVSLQPDSARFVKLVLEEESSLARLDPDAEVPTGKPSASGNPKANTNWFDKDNVGTASTAASNGADGDAVTEGNVQGEEAEKTGIYALEKADLFNMLCLPPLVREDEISPETYAAALTYCLRRRAMLIVDPPSSWKSIAQAENNIDSFRNALGGEDKTRNAALYFPRLRMADPAKDNRLADFVPCGAIAGVFARTDVSRGVWKAPAGVEAAIAGLRSFTLTMTDPENGRLNPQAVNCLRTFPDQGNLVWGARTLAGSDAQASEHKYVPVRRLTLFLEESLYRGTQWVVFEPNDEPLWAQIRLNVGAFMRDLFRQGAFQGRTTSQAYFVKCDSDTTTQNDINRGIVNIEVGFAPLKPAEFVILKIQQIAGQIET